MNAHWTAQALGAALRYVTGLTPAAAPASLWAALSSSSADPDGDGFTELLVANYVRQEVTLGYTSAFVVASTADVHFANLGAGSYLGIGLFDSATFAGGDLWFWADLDTEVEIDTGATVTLRAGLIKAAISG